MTEPSTTTTRTTNKSEYTQALDLLTRYLALRDHSRLELQQKLSRRFDAALVEQVLNDADAKGWMGVPEEIAARAALVWQRRKKSRRYVEEQLQKRGLPLPAHDEVAELENARMLLVRKFGPPEDLSDEDRQKAHRFLEYRGFADQLIRTVLK